LGRIPVAQPGDEQARAEGELPAEGRRRRLRRRGLQPGEVSRYTPREVRLSRFGGTLALDLREDPDSSPASPREFLVHGGSYVPVAYLRGWAAINPQNSEDEAAQSRGDHLVIPAMEPGIYRLCSSTIAESWRLALSNPSPTGCASGRPLLGSDLAL